MKNLKLEGAKLPAKLPDEGFARERQVLAVLGFGRGLLEKKVRAGEFCKPVMLSERVKAYPVVGVREWIARKAAG